MGEDTFLQRCNEWEISSKRAKKLFSMLRAHIGQRSLSAEDLKALLIGQEPSDMEAMWGTWKDEGKEGAEPKVEQDAPKYADAAEPKAEQDEPKPSLNETAED